MPDFQILPTQQDVNSFFEKHPDALQELHFLTLQRMHSEALMALAATEVAEELEAPEVSINGQ